MKPTRIWATLALSMSFLATTVPVVAQNLAIVNGKPIPMARFNAVLKQISTQSGGGSAAAISEEQKKQLRDEFITQELLAQEAQSRGLDRSETYLQMVEQAKQMLLIRTFLEDEEKRNPITPEMIKAEYDKATAGASKEYLVRHILVKKEEEAKKILEALKKGAKFDQLAKKESLDKGSGAQGGLLGWSQPSSYVPEFGQALTKLTKGQMTAQPIKSEFGWHIIQLDDVRSVKFPELAQVEPQIRQMLKQQRMEALQTKLKASAKIQ